MVFEPKAIETSPGSPMRPGASSAEQDLVALYSAMVRGLKADSAVPYTTAADYLTSKVHWAVRVARDQFQLTAMLNLICAFVNKRVGELGDALAPLLGSIWAQDIQDTTQPFEIRRRGLLVYLHASLSLAIELTSDREGFGTRSQRPCVLLSGEGG